MKAATFSILFSSSNISKSLDFSSISQLIVTDYPLTIFNVFLLVYLPYLNSIFFKAYFSSWYAYLYISSKAYDSFKVFFLFTF